MLDYEHDALCRNENKKCVNDGVDRGTVFIMSAFPARHLSPELECKFKYLLRLKFSGFSMW